MSPQDLLKLLVHIRVWLPRNSQIRNEVTDMIRNIRAQIGMPPEIDA